MQNNNELPEEKNLSDNPQENMRMQNELLKIKMMLESGAVFCGGEDVPPEIENQFLNNILEFEKINSSSNSKKVKDILGKPTFAAEESLDDEKFKKAFTDLNNHLKEHLIQVDFSRERTDRFKYNFITGELFDYKLSFLPAPGMTTYFSYEEFYPDHEMDIKETTSKFLNDFLEIKLDADAYFIENQISEPDGKIVSKEEYMKRIEIMYEATSSFENYSFDIENTNFEIKENNKEIKGMGFSEGNIKYDIVFKNGERKIIDGPFKIYFMLTWEVWSVFFFYLAGFNINKK